MVNHKFRSSVTDRRVFRGANIDSDHRLVVCSIQLKLKVALRKPCVKQFDVRKLELKPIQQEEYAVEIQNQFDALSDTLDDPESEWNTFKEGVNASAEKVTP